MTPWRYFYRSLSRGAAGCSAVAPGHTLTVAAVLLLMAVGGGIVGYAWAAEKPPVKAAKAKAPPAAAVEEAEAPPPPDPVETLKQETQEKFDAEAKALAEIRNNLDKLGQDIRVNAKSIQDLKAKLEENAILVYEHLSRGISGAEKLERMSDRLEALESRLGIRGKARPRNGEASGQKPTEPEPPDSATASPPPGEATKVQEASANPAAACPAESECGSVTQPQAEPPPLPDRASDEPSGSEPVRLLIAAVLVFIVLPGVTLLEMSQLEAWALPQAGLRNLLVAAVVVLAYFAVGHGWMYGEMVFGAPVPESDAGSAEAFRLYQLALALTASLVVTTILSDRLSLPAYVFLALLFSGLAYPVLGHWIWGGQGLPHPIGWLERRGFRDFAGATVIHSFAAWFALGWIWRFPVTRFLGPAEPGADAIPRPNPALASLGVFLVWLGWFGLAMGPGDGNGPPAALAIVNTLLAGSAALLAALTYLLVPPRDSAAGAVFARVSAGTVAGLVALSAGVDRVTPVEAIAIGALAGLLQPLAYRALATKLIRRDQVAANLVAAYGVSGAFGTLCVGLFGSPGTFTAPNPAQLGNQVLGILAALGLGLATGLAGALLCEGCSKLNALRRGT